MFALVVYESMYGNTHRVAVATGEGLSRFGPVDILPVGQVTSDALQWIDLLVVGGPTHDGGLSRPGTRRAAAAATNESAGPPVEAGGVETGLREWLAEVGLPDGLDAAAFDTLQHPRVAVGDRASTEIHEALQRSGAHLVAPPESFLVDELPLLMAGERERAVEWGHWLGVLATQRVAS